MEQIRVDGAIKDYVKIAYQGSDTLFVPATQLDMVSKYIGSGGEDGNVRLNKIGSDAWQKTKAKAKKAAKDMGIKEIAVAGGVSANSGLRDALIDLGKRHHWKVHIPPFSYTTDNAAMVCQAGYFKYLDGEFCPMDAAPYAKTKI
jgi:transcription-repair coupling factor (superfamily II helicase)